MRMFFERFWLLLKHSGILSMLIAVCFIAVGATLVIHFGETAYYGLIVIFFVGLVISRLRA